MIEFFDDVSSVYLALLIALIGWHPVKFSGGICLRQATSGGKTDQIVGQLVCKKSAFVSAFSWDTEIVKQSK